MLIGFFEISRDWRFFRNTKTDVTAEVDDMIKIGTYPCRKRHFNKALANCVVGDMLPVALHIRTGVGTTSLADPGLTAPRGDQCSINCPLHYNDMCNVTYNYWYARMSLLALFWWFILLCKHIYFIYQNSKVEVLEHT